MDEFKKLITDVFKECNTIEETDKVLSSLLNVVRKGCQERDNEILKAK